MSTPFVVPQGFTQIPPDYAYKQVGMRVFPLKAGQKPLKALVGACLNNSLPPGQSFAPIPTLTAYAPVYLMISTYGSMASKQKPFSDWGTMSQTEAIIMIPLLIYKNGKVDGVALFTPYAFVDNAWSIITGNMIMGFQKGLAAFQLPPALQQSYPLEIRTPVFPVFNNDTPLTWETWIRIEKLAGPNLLQGSERLWPLGPVDTLFGPRGEFEVDAAVLAVLEGVHTGPLCAVQLLQLRDPVNPELAAYSKLVMFDINLTAFREAGLLASAQLHLSPFASLPVAAVLGLVFEQGWLHSVLPYWIDCDFDFDLKSVP